MDCKYQLWDGNSSRESEEAGYVFVEAVPKISSDRMLSPEELVCRNQGRARNPDSGFQKLQIEM